MINQFEHIKTALNLSDDEENRIINAFKDKEVSIEYSDCYAVGYLHCQMIVGLIYELQKRLEFKIIKNGLKFYFERYNKTRGIINSNYSEDTVLHYGFLKVDDRDNYILELCYNEFDKVAIFPNKYDGRLVNHHRWLKIATEDGATLEIRPDGGIAHNWCSLDKLKYKDININSPTLDKSLIINKSNINKDMLYYLIFKQA